ncbi:hypothetical protein BGZ72_000160 [Mortierella alpina]|nr:hypothetical protein BGZ72_000160 [Mortierella alpina]
MDDPINPLDLPEIRHLVKDHLQHADIARCLRVELGVTRPSYDRLNDDFELVCADPEHEDLHHHRHCVETLIHIADLRFTGPQEGFEPTLTRVEELLLAVLDLQQPQDLSIQGWHFGNGSIRILGLASQQLQSLKLESYRFDGFSPISPAIGT